VEEKKYLPLLKTPVFIGFSDDLVEVEDKTNIFL